MPFEFRCRSSVLAQAASVSLSQALSHGRRLTGALALVMAVSAVPAQAQNAKPNPELSPDAAAAIAALTGQSPGNAGTATPSPSESGDPISRFLSDKGILNTKPVTDLAQQVRDKATNVASELVLSAMNFLGVPYKRGGQSSENGFDCSGFTRHVFENSVGLLLPRRASEQANSPDLVPVKQAELKPGDLVFFNTLRHTFSHVGIYIGDNKFIHSPRAGGEVRVEDMRLSYWQKRFDGARRAPKVEASESVKP
ncbi:C40 family peptidase [Aquabacterium sp.]|uniref:C40 family peptidase n=1 Tax=Aquabacterium sp. TaxID=1872578 RepID=UPI003D6CC0A8